MSFETVYRPPSEADAFILRATHGCSWNACTYCAMYRDREFALQPIERSLASIDQASALAAAPIEKVFVADGDALVMPTEDWLPILERCRERFPALRRVSAYATARNLNDKSVAELTALRQAGLSLLYVGPESGDNQTLKKIAKGADFERHVSAAARAHEAGIALSTIFLLGIAGEHRSAVHAERSAALITAMDPAFVALLTLTIVPGTPIARQVEKQDFRLPGMHVLLGEIRAIVQQAAPTDAILRANHASNYLPIRGRIPQDRERIIELVERALEGQVPLRPEWSRGL